MTKALLKNYRQSPRKVRLITDAIKGKKVNDALNTLQFMAKRGALPIRKVLESAIANAKNNNISVENLFVKEITVDEGVTLKRWMPKWRGTAHPIRKRTSHVRIVLGTKDDKKQVVSEQKTEKIEESKEVKKEKKPVKKATKKVTKSKK